MSRDLFRAVGFCVTSCVLAYSMKSRPVRFSKDGALMHHIPSKDFCSIRGYVSNLHVEV